MFSVQRQLVTSSCRQNSCSGGRSTGRNSAYPNTITRLTLRPFRSFPRLVQIVPGAIKLDWFARYNKFPERDKFELVAISRDVAASERPGASFSAFIVFSQVTAFGT